MFATTRDGDGVDVGIEDAPCASIGDGDGVVLGIMDGPRASIKDRDGLTSIEGEDGVGATSEYLIGIYTVDDGDGVDDDRLSLSGSSLTTYRFSSHLSLSHWSHVMGVEEGQHHQITYLYIENNITNN